ncbi:MAG: rhodanese-like domain-containing protein [Bacilli bacterium]|nr:rhodanese-like domain-containing protein [Bacilli bacterium]
MKKILLILIIFILVGCTKIEEPDLNKLMHENDHIIVDVRTPAEYESLHLVGAINIPFDEIDEDVDLDKEKLIFVYCKSGNRSKIASDILENLGYKTYDLGAISNIDLPKE